MSRLKKAVVYLFFALVFILISSFTAFAVESGDIGAETYVEASGAQSVFDSLPESYAEMLKSLGLDEISYESAVNIGFKDAFFLIAQMFEKSLASPLKAAISAAGVIIIFAVFSAYMAGADAKGRNAAALCECLAVCGIVTVPVSQFISHACSIIKLSADFMLLLIPVLVGIVAAGGRAISAAGWNTLAFSAAQAFSYASEHLISPVIRALLSVNLISAVTQEFRLESIGSFIKKSLTVFMGLSATLFSGILTVKGILTSSADTAVMKGAKFLSGSFIPIVGGALGEAASSIVGAVSLAKNTVGAAGIIAISVICLGIIEAVTWTLLLFFLEMSAKMLGRDTAAKAVQAISSAVSLLNITLIINASVMIITIGVMVSVRMNV